MPTYLCYDTIFYIMHLYSNNCYKNNRCSIFTKRGATYYCCYSDVNLNAQFLVGIPPFGRAVNAAFMRIYTQKDEDALTNEGYFYFLKQGLKYSFYVVLINAGSYHFKYAGLWYRDSLPSGLSFFHSRFFCL